MDLFDIDSIQRISELEGLIKKYQKSYYDGEGDISDAEFDALWDELKSLDPSNPLLHKVGADSGNFEKVNHVINEVSLNGQIVKVDSTNKYIWPKFLFRDILYAWRINYYGGKLTNNEWQKSDSLLVSGHGHNEFEHIVLSQDNDGALFVLNCPMMGDKLISLTKIPHADSIAAIKEESKWKKYDLGQLPPFWNSGRTFVVLSDSSILVAGTLVNEINHIFSTIDFKNQRAVPLDYWPDDGLKCDSISKYQLYATQCVLLGNGKGKFLYKNDWGRVAFIFTIDGHKVNILSSLYSHTFTKTPPTEQLACCVNSNRIFMLLRDSDSKGVKLDKYNEKKTFIFLMMILVMGSL